MMLTNVQILQRTPYYYNYGVGHVAVILELAREEEN